MTIVVRAPSPTLAPFVAAVGYYGAGSAGRRDLLLPTGCLHLGVNLAEDRVRWYDGDGFATVHARRGVVLWDAAAGPVGVDLADQRAVVGVLFRPGGAYPFFGPQAAAIDEPLVELEALWGRDGALLRDRLLEAATPQAALSTVEAVLLERVERSWERDPAVAWAARTLARGARVAEVAGRLGMTQGRFLPRFTEQVGLTPKRFARVRRLQRLLAWVRPGQEVDWARAAAECGYFDQAHLINDFRALTGTTPGRYRPRSAALRNHLPLPG